MGHFANVLEFAPTRRSADVAAWESAFPAHPARLVPGSDAQSRGKEVSQSIRDGDLRRKSTFSLAYCQKSLMQFLPESLLQVHPSQLGAALLDLFFMTALFCIAAKRLDVQSTAFGPSHSALYVVMFLIFAAQGGLYRNSNASIAAKRRLIFKALLWTTLLAELAQIEKSPKAVLLPLVLVSAMSFFSLSFFRWIWNRLCSPDPATRQPHNVLIVGNPTLYREIARAIEVDLQTRRSVKAFLSERDFQTASGAARLRIMARQGCIDEVIVATQNTDVADAVIDAARRNQLDATLPAFLMAEPIAIERVSGITLLKIRDQRFPEFQLALKRIVDVVLATAGLLVLSPLLLLIALVIKLDSRGPVFYSALRLGYRGHEFTCHKFRTMIREADAEKDQLRARNEREGAFFKILNDPRITRVGRFLRHYSLDELPQFWNVLRGEMSLVGPRPHPLDDVNGYGLEHFQRLDFVPGLTGLWQVTARQDPSFERSVALDIDYIKHWSPALDLRILFRTFKTVMQGGGA